MRNLKRALSLALASVMLLGMMVVGTSASYADVDSKDNVEAIEVMKAVGVMIGDDKGNFNPDSYVTRNEMAVVMANLLDLKVVDFSAASIKFTDVPAWAAKYVAACKADGIIAGYSETVFGGSDTVTAAQAALMMLKALGYFQYQNDFGDDWQLATVTQASKIELFDDVDAGAGTPLTRNEVAQLALNALEATMVEPDGDGGTTIKGDGFEITTGTVKYENRTTTKYDYTRANGKYDKNSSENTLQLCEQLFKEDLTKTSVSGGDKYGRPATKWTYEKDEIGTYADEPDAVYTANVKAKDMYSDLGLSNSIAAENITVYVDGSITNSIDKEDITKTNVEKYKQVRGGVMEVYLTDDDTEATICYIYNYIGVVTDADAKKDGDDGIYVEVDGAEYFIEDATGYSDDDIVIANLGVKDSKVEAEIVGKPETVTGYASSISSDDDLTIGGTKYYMGGGFTTGDDDVVEGIAASAFKADKDVTYIVYIDELGNMLAVVEDEDNSTDDVVYVHDVVVGSVMDGKTVKYAALANVVYTDGTVEDIQVSDTYKTEKGVEDDADYKAAAAEKGKFATLNYDKNDDEYTIEALDPDDYSVRNEALVSADIDSSDKRVKLGSAATKYSLKSDTVYLFIELDGDDIDTVEVVVGDIDYTFEASKTVSGKFVADGTTAKYVVVVGESYSSKSDDVVYVDNESYNDKTEDDYYTSDAYFLGDKRTTEITVATVDGKDATGAKLNGFFKFSEKSDGSLKLTKATPDSYAPDKDSYVVNVKITDVDTDNDVLSTASFDADIISGSVLVDLTDADKASENAYGRNITSFSSLEKLLDREVNGKVYEVTASIFVNEDSEVENVFITNIKLVEKA